MLSILTVVSLTRISGLEMMVMDIVTGSLAVGVPRPHCAVCSLPGNAAGFY